MREDLFDETPHMGVVGHVVDPGTVTSGADQPGQAQFRQVLRDPGRMGPYERRQLVYRMLAVEQGPNDAEAGLVTEELEHPHSGLELVLGGNHIYLRIHADSIARNQDRCPHGQREGSLTVLRALNQS
jgi:hypothetical protein